MSKVNTAKLRILSSDKYLKDFYLSTITTGKFDEFAKFNPLAKSFDRSLISHYLHEGAIRKPIAPTTLNAYRYGYTCTTMPFFLGILYNIYKELGEKMLYTYMQMYIDDFIYRTVPFAPSVVYEAIYKRINNDIELPKLPNELRVAKLKVLLAWDKDLTTSRAYCEPLGDYPLTGQMKAKHLAEYAGIGITRYRNLLYSGKGIWSDKDIRFAIYWCIATKVHPLRLLNTAGLWITNKENKPDDFSNAHYTSLRDAKEVRLVEQDNGLFDEVRQLKRFRGSFIAGFARAIRDITFITLDQDCELQHKELLTAELVNVLECVEYQDFSEVGFVKWKPFTDFKGSERFCEFLKSFHYQEINSSVKYSRKRRNREKAASSLTITGNPIFDKDLFYD